MDPPTRQVSAWLVPAPIATGAHSPAREPGVRPRTPRGTPPLPTGRRPCARLPSPRWPRRQLADLAGASSPTSPCATSAAPRPAAPPTGCSPRPPPETLAPTRCPACRACSRGTRSQGESQTWCKGPKDCTSTAANRTKSRGIQARSHLNEESAGAHLNLATSPRHASSRRGAYRVRCDPNVAAPLRRVPRSASWHP